MPNLRAVFFDFDGLILDTEDACYAAWNSVFQEHGVEYKLEEFQSIVGTAGDPRPLLEQKVRRALDWSAIDPDRRARETELGRTMKIKPGVLALADRARALGWKCAIVSSSPHDWVRGHLERRGALDRFDDFICRGDVDRVKPAPDLYREAVCRCGINPSEAVTFEDSHHGAVSAKAAGIWCVAVPNDITRTMDFSPAHLLVESLEDINLDTLGNDLENGRGLGSK